MKTIEGTTLGAAPTLVDSDLAAGQVVLLGSEGRAVLVSDLPNADLRTLDFS